MHTSPVIQSRPCMNCDQVTITVVTEAQDAALAAGEAIHEVFSEMSPADREVFIIRYSSELLGRNVRSPAHKLKGQAL